MNETKTALSSIAHYDQNVFPRIEKGEKPFNFLAALFGPFWFAYKGLKSDYFKLVAPFAVAQGIAEAFSINAAILGIAIAGIILFGTEANKRYYSALKSNNKPTNNILMGIGGLLMYVFLQFSSSFIVGFSLAIIKRM